MSHSRIHPGVELRSLCLLLAVSVVLSWYSVASRPIDLQPPLTSRRDTLPAAPSTLGTITVSLGTVIAGGGLLLNVVEHYSRPAAGLEVELRLDTLAVPMTQPSAAPGFSEPWVRGAIAIRNVGSAAATGVAVISPVDVARWRFVLERVGARDSAAFAEGRLSIGQLPPGAWAAVSLWWPLGHEPAPLSTFVVLHDAGTEYPVLVSRQPPLQKSVIIGLALAGAGGLVFAISTIIGRLRRRARAV